MGFYCPHEPTRAFPNTRSSATNVHHEAGILDILDSLSLPVVITVFICSIAAFRRIKEIVNVARHRTPSVLWSAVHESTTPSRLVGGEAVFCRSNAARWNVASRRRRRRSLSGRIVGFPPWLSECVGGEDIPHLLIAWAGRLDPRRRWPIYC